MTSDFIKIEKVIENYFQGTFNADEKQIRLAFHKDVQITGNIDESYVEMNLNQFIERVMSSVNNNSKYDKKIIAIDLHCDIAMVKAKVLVGDIYFTDFITLLKLDDNWTIRQKSFTNAFVCESSI